MAVRGRPVIVCPVAVSTTEGATSTVIAGSDLSAVTPALGDCAVLAVAKFIGRDTSNGNSVGGEMMQTFKYVSGVLTMDGTMVVSSALGGVPGLLASVPLFASSSTTVQAKMTGVAITTISWVCWMELYVNGA